MQQQSPTPTTGNSLFSFTAPLSQQKNVQSVQLQKQLFQGQRPQTRGGGAASQQQRKQQPASTTLFQTPPPPIPTVAQVVKQSLTQNVMPPTQLQQLSIPTPNINNSFLSTPTQKNPLFGQLQLAQRATTPAASNGIAAGLLKKKPKIKKGLPKRVPAVPSVIPKRRGQIIRVIQGLKNDYTTIEDLLQKITTILEHPAATHVPRSTGTTLWTTTSSPVTEIQKRGIQVQEHAKIYQSIQKLRTQVSQLRSQCAAVNRRVMSPPPTPVVAPPAVSSNVHKEVGVLLRKAIRKIEKSLRNTK